MKAADFIALAKATGAYSFDVEHNPDLSWSQPGFKLGGVSFCSGDPSAPVAFYCTDPAEYTAIIRALFPLDLYAIAYNGKYDLKCLVADGVITCYEYCKHLIDPMVMVNLLDENRHPGEMGLKIVVYDQYGHQMMTFPEAWAHGEHSPQFAKYATEDAYWEFRLFVDLKPKMEEEGLWKILTRVYMPMTKVASDMEMVGVGWDIPGAKKLMRGFQLLRQQLQEEIYGEIGELNLGSGDQVAKRLFDELGYSTRGLEMTDSGRRVKTDAKSMEKLAKRYPICDKITRWKTCSKMIGTYIEPLTRLALADPKGRIHPTMWLISVTGRTRMEKPNFQNIPAWLDKIFKHLNIRNNIVPKPGYKLIVADLSQIELRLCGHISLDPSFLAAYRDWQCTACGKKGSEVEQILHSCPNCHKEENEAILKDKNIPGFWHGLDLHQMTTDAVPALGGDRQYGKTCNFALIYCATAPRLHYEYPAFSIKQWDEVIWQYFKQYQGVRRWHIEMEQMMHTLGVTRDIFGRKRRITKHDIHKSAKHALNQFVNMPVQASACHYIEICMANLREHWIREKRWMKDIVQSNFVHDEGIWECPEEHVDGFVPIIRHYMENSVRFQVPIRTSIAVVDAWGLAK